LVDLFDGNAQNVEKYFLLIEIFVYNVEKKNKFIRSKKTD
jgi:hypothetical protein